MAIFSRVALLVLIITAAVSAFDYTNCELCHKEGGPAPPAPPGLLRSTHGSFVSCLDCHPGANEAHSKGTGALTCTICHNDIAESYAKSAHRMGTIDGPTCYTCHGYGHNVHPLSYEGFKPAYAPAVCMECHNAETGSFMESGCSVDPEEVGMGGMVLGCYHCHGPVHEIGHEEVRKHELALKRLELCAECHSDGEGKMGVVNLWETSVHASVDAKTGLFGASCDDCHIPHDSRLPSLLTPLTLFANAPKSCKGCHEDEYRKYERSVHGKAVAAGSELAPDCIDCHGGHGIGTASGWNKETRIVQCIACHNDDDIMIDAGVALKMGEKFEHTFHGKANFFDFNKAADCVDCHTSHSVLPKTDPKSSVHEDNLLATCSANECHPDATESFVMAGGHLLDRGDNADPVQKWTAFFFTWLTRGVIFLLIIHMAAEFTRDLPAVLRERKERKNRKKGNGNGGKSSRLKKFFKKLFPFLPIGVAYAEGGDTIEAVIDKDAIAVEDTGLRITRFNTAELLQHWVMLVTFIILMLTGLPLKFPDVAWAGPLYDFFGGIEIARIIHRAAGVIMVGDFIFHVFYVAIQYLRTKGKFKALIDPSKTTVPLPKDFVDVYHNILYVLRIRKEPPRFGRFSYKEKFDYWAVFWGMFIMGGSGFILMFPVTASKLMPGWLIPIAMIGHSDEAVLAILAIVIWHFYNVHFNPKKFPMSRVWLSGTLTEEEMEEEHPLEYEIKKDRGDYREERVMK